MTSERRTYRVNADSWTVLKDILVGTPEEFNQDLTKGYDRRNGVDKWAGTLRGRHAHNGITFGKLPEGMIASVSQADYVIYSYNTPIAWRLGSESLSAAGQWVVPNVRYSVTTTKHQGKVRTALSQVNGGYTV